VKIVGALLLGCLGLAVSGCTQRAGNQSSAKSKDTADGSVSTRADPAPSAQLKGNLASSEFVGRAAYADVYTQWVSITIADREGSCEDRRLRDTDMAVQVRIPTGPNNDLFVDRPIQLAVQLSGAVGVGAIPAGFSSVRIASFNPGRDSQLRGNLSFRYRTGSDPGAPVYEAAGSFEARVCSRQATAASMPQLDRSVNPVGGTVAGQPRSFPSFLAFARPLPGGGRLLSIKAYTRKDMNCYSETSTPYLFGLELGPGPNSDYFATSLMPADWIMQMSTGLASERSVHAGDGAGTVQVESVTWGKGARVRATMSAATVSETDPNWAYSISGTFEAPICEQP
jgi:hypothetical protein